VAFGRGRDGDCPAVGGGTGGAEEAFLAAYAARSVGDRAAEEAFLIQASKEGSLSELARVELAEHVVGEDGGRAVELVVPTVRRAPTREVREAAVAVAVAALEQGLEGSARTPLEQTVRHLPRSIRRPLELALAATDDDAARQRLGRVLASSTRDLEAMQAARLLLSLPQPTDSERWWIAQTLYRHALYDEAQPLLESLDGVNHRSISRWQVAFLRGRCAFRRGEWEEAAEWYGKANDRTGGRERSADLEVHQARAYELDGRIDDAVAAAQRAVRLRTTDDRRLFLARLRLRRDEPELAVQGISKVRGRTARSRGELLVALFHLRRGEVEEAKHRLSGIRRAPWTSPAAVLAAELAIADGDPAEAISRLEQAAAGLDEFWAKRSRELMVMLGETELARWRARHTRIVEDATGRTRRSSLAILAMLEPDREQLAGLEEEVVREVGLDGVTEPPVFAPGLADELWRLGLGSQAVRWDPWGLPRDDARSALWTARQFLEHGAIRRAIVTADAAWRMAGSDLPIRVYPTDLKQALYPLPRSKEVWQAAVASRVPWSLLAALAREESRWEPRAVSRVGARGLMQLMPGTASDVAKRLGQPPPTAEELFDPGLSLDLGAAEMRRLMDVFSGRWAPAIAAYNAGEAQAVLWLEQCGEGVCRHPQLHPERARHRRHLR